jgi:hypothetical protein
MNKREERPVFLEEFSDDVSWHDFTARIPTPHHPTIAYLNVSLIEMGYHSHFVAVRLSAVTKSGERNTLDTFKFHPGTLWYQSSGSCGWHVGGRWAGNVPDGHDVAADHVGAVVQRVREAIELVLT